MRMLLKITLLAITGLILLLVALLAAVSSNAPLATAPRPVTPEVARQVKQIAKQMQFGLNYLQHHTMTVSEEEIVDLFAVAARALPRLSGDARISSEGSEIRTSLHLPENPFGNYINLSLGLPPHSTGMVIDHLSIGALTLHGASARAVIETTANLAFGGDEGTKLLATIEEVRTTNERLIVSYRPTPHLDEKLAAALTRLQPWREPLDATGGDAIRHYYGQLCDSDYPASMPLSQPLSAVLQQAAARSSNASEAVAENRAALLALAIRFGNDRFNTLANAIDDTTLKRCQQQIPDTTLAGRHDLALHFIYSAAIKIIADSQASFAVGELKEMADSLQGGSGFSFADLAADESGIRFAEVATTPESARRLQKEISAAEGRFFPAIDALPEGIPRDQFERQYGGNSSAAYNRLLDEIRRRIANLPLYRPAE